MVECSNYCDIPEQVKEDVEKGIGNAERPRRRLVELMARLINIIIIC